MQSLQSLKALIDDQLRTVSEDVVKINDETLTLEASHRASIDFCLKSSSAAYNGFARWLAVRPTIDLWISGNEEVHRTGSSCFQCFGKIQEIKKLKEVADYCQVSCSSTVSGLGYYYLLFLLGL